MDEWDLSLIDSVVFHQLAFPFLCETRPKYPPGVGERHSFPPSSFFLCFCVLGRLFSFREMTDPDANDLGPNCWAERSAHMVQGSLSYDAAASPSRGAAVVDAEIMSANAADDDLESDPGFVRNCVRMSAFEKEHYHPNTQDEITCFLSLIHI